MLKDKVVVITGGAGLIGKEFVKAIIENNGIAIIADINEQIGLDVKENLSKELNTKNIDFVQLDITSKDSLNKCINYLDDKYKKIGCETDEIIAMNYYTQDFYSSCFYLNKQEECEEALRKLEASPKSPDKENASEIRKNINELQELIEFYKSL